MPAQALSEIAQKPWARLAFIVGATWLLRSLVMNMLIAPLLRALTAAIAPQGAGTLFLLMPVVYLVDILIFIVLAAAAGAVWRAWSGRGPSLWSRYHIACLAAAYILIVIVPGVVFAYFIVRSSAIDQMIFLSQLAGWLMLPMPPLSVLVSVLAGDAWQRRKAGR